VIWRSGHRVIDTRVSRVVSAVSREPEARAKPLAAEPLK
jgi:hypothetical protein